MLPGDLIGERVIEDERKGLFLIPFGGLTAAAAAAAAGESGEVPAEL